MFPLACLDSFDGSVPGIVGTLGGYDLEPCGGIGICKAISAAPKCVCGVSVQQFFADRSDQVDVSCGVALSRPKRK
jgi:hypothetical protein